MNDEQAQAQLLLKDTHSKTANYVKAILLGSQFLLLMSAFNSAKNMISLIYEQSGMNNLGTISIIVLYIGFGSFNIFAPNICIKFNPKYIMALSSIGYTLFIASGILVSLCENETSFICSKSIIYLVVNFTAFLCGISGSTLWVSQAWYISNISTMETRGIYFGTFWGLVQSSQIVGNLLGLGLLSYSTSNSVFLYFLVLTIVSGLSGISFLALPNPPKKAQEIIKLRDKINGMFLMIRSKKMRYLLIYYYFAGSIVAFFVGFLYKLIKLSLPEDMDQDTIRKKSAYCFIVLGIFEFIGGFVSGYVADRVNRFLVATVSTLIVELAIIISAICYYTNNYTLCFIDAALWGLSDCIIQNMCTVLTSTLFPDRIEGFAIAKLFQAIGVSTVLVANIFLHQPIIFITIMGGIQIITTISIANLGIKQIKVHNVQ